MASAEHGERLIRVVDERSFVLTVNYRCDVNQLMGLGTCLKIESEVDGRRIPSREKDRTL